MKQRELAEALGVNPAVVCRDAKRGMPTHSLEAARNWRRRHVSPYIKSKPAARHEDDPLAGIEAILARAAVVPREDAQAVAQALGDVAGARLEAGQSITGMVPALRAALRALLPDHADPLPYPMPVMLELVAEVRACVEASFESDDAREADHRQFVAGGEAMEREMGAFWTRAAAGLVTIP